jgi:dTDP-4-amino-4,6-dideoxygalactose transaminase
VPSNICPIVPAIFLKAQVPFELVDISIETLEIDKNILFEKLKKSKSAYSGILWLRSYGVSNENNQIFKALKEINEQIMIIDDRCLMRPKFDDDCGYADLIIYSTGYSKFVDYSWGGYGYINSNENTYNSTDLSFDEDDLRKLNDSFRKSIESRTKFKYNDSNWLGGSQKLDFDHYMRNIKNDLPKIAQHKENLNSLYEKYLPEEAQLPSSYHDWRFNILVNNNTLLLESIFKKKLFASNHYYPMTKFFKNGNTPNSEKLYRHIINLFNDRRYSEDMTIETIEIVNQHIKKWGVAEI